MDGGRNIGAKMAMKSKQDLMDTVGEYLGAIKKRSKKSYLTNDELNEAVVDILPILMTESQPTNADVIGAYSLFVERFASCSDEITKAVNAGVSRIKYEASNSEQGVRRAISICDSQCRELQDLFEKIKKIKRDPNGVEASSLSPERWHCELCGCKMGRVSLDGVTWGYIPKFCPGCGAPVIEK